MNGPGSNLIYGLSGNFTCGTGGAKLFRGPFMSALQWDVLYYRHETNLDTRHACGGRHGSGIFHCILGGGGKGFMHGGDRLCEKSPLMAPPTVIPP
ncbi:hypothetical protein AVEN_110351-1 [Araneus ventricosus]|uniref:Uncharacterized protein n=1 Tax=Araneus ventricosus TaxID=182803 RepID=A0A4Y2EPB3_ARAVE|nr:hypothetical protein AVEN_110351-1 [Araneus ventricosus]